MQSMDTWISVASPSNQTQVTGIHHLIPGQRILLDISTKHIRFKLEQNVRDVSQKLIGLSRILESI